VMEEERGIKIEFDENCDRVERLIRERTDL
jgi:hypothetical protein